MKCAKIKHLIKISNTYSFSHFNVQEFLCSLYIVVAMSQKEQKSLMKEHFCDLPNIMRLLCGMTRLESQENFLFVFKQLSSGSDYLFANNDHVLTAVRCICESQQLLPQFAILPINLILKRSTLCPYDIICVSYTIRHFFIVTLNLSECFIGDQGLSNLSYWCVNKLIQLRDLDLRANHITSAGIPHISEIIRSKLLVGNFVS